MKKFRIVFALLSAVMIMLSMSVNVFADTIKSVDGIMYRYSDSGELKRKYSGWANSKKGLKYYKDGKLVKDKWVTVKDGRKYYINSKGIREIGWVSVKNHWYYVTPKLGQLTGKCTIDGVSYTFGEDGRWDKNYSYNGKSISDIYNIINARVSEKAYGGMYISNGMLMIWSIDGRAEKAVERLLPGVKCIFYKKAKYSLKEMNRIVNTIIETYAGDWTSVYVDDFTNRIILGVTKIQRERINPYINSLKNKDCVTMVDEFDFSFNDDLN